MKKNSLLRFLSLTLVSALAAGTLAACSGGGTAAGSSPSADAQAAGTASASGPVLVGTGGYPKPYTYQDTDGTLKGMDIDLMRAVFKDTGYNLDFEVTEFASVLAGLDTGRYQAGANSFAKTAEREEKYLFSKPIYRNPLGITVPVDSDIDSFDDLAGKTTTSEPSVSYTAILEAYNKEHADNPVTINYTEKDLVLQFQDVVDGASDFKLESAIIANYVVTNQGLSDKLKVIEVPADQVKTRSAFAYYIFPKTEQGEQLRDFVNGRLEKLRADGTLKTLLEQYFGKDYSPTDEEFNSK